MGVLVIVLVPRTYMDIGMELLTVSMEITVIISLKQFDTNHRLMHNIEIIQRSSSIEINDQIPFKNSCDITYSKIIQMLSINAIF